MTGVQDSAKSLQSCPTLCNPMDCSHQAPLSVGFSREECWSGLSYPFPGDLPHPGIKPASLKSPALAGEFFTASVTNVKFGHLISLGSFIKCR